MFCTHFQILYYMAKQWGFGLTFMLWNKYPLWKIISWLDHFEQRWIPIQDVFLDFFSNGHSGHMKILHGTNPSLFLPHVLLSMLPEDKSYPLFLREILEHGSSVGIFKILDTLCFLLFSFNRLCKKKVYSLTTKQALSLKRAWIFYV